MAWDFDGVDQYARFTMNATLQAAPGGPMTMACVVHFDAVTDGAVIHMLTSGAASRPWIEVFANWNYGTTAGARSGPAGTTGAWYLAIFSKQTGNVAPEYTLIPLATGTPTSGTMTGGGATLGDGTAAGAGGIIQVARWGTSATEYINGRIAATAIWNVYTAQAGREALTTWALWLASSGIQWAVRFDTLSTLTDATGLGGGETGRFGTASITLAADPGALAIDFFATGSGGVTVQDTSGGGGTTGSTDGLAVGDGSSGGGTAGSTDGRALGDTGSGAAGTGGNTDGRSLGAGSDGGQTSGSGDGLAVGAGSDGLGTSGSTDGLAVGDTSGGGGTAGSTDTVVTGGVTVQDTSGGGGSGGSTDGRALGAGSDGGGAGGSATGTALGDGGGGAGTGGSTEGRALGDTSGGAATGSSGDTVAGGPVTISDTSGGAGTGGSPDTAETSQVVHDKMVMPIVIKAHECLLVEVGKVTSPPKHVQIRPGASFIAMADQVGDECCDGIAWVRPGSQTPTTGHWPDPIENVDGVDGGQPVYWAIQVELGIERCIPTVSNVEGEDRRAPTGAQWLQATQDHLDDAAALRRAVCCLMEIYGNDGVLMGPITPLQNEGNCGGQTVVITVRAPACDCIDAG